MCLNSKSLFLRPKTGYRIIAAPRSVHGYLSTDLKLVKWLLKKYRWYKERIKLTDWLDHLFPQTRFTLTLFRFNAKCMCRGAYGTNIPYFTLSKGNLYYREGKVIIINNWILCVNSCCCFSMKIVYLVIGKYDNIILI